LAQAPSVCRDHRTRHTPRERHNEIAAPVGKHHDDDALRREKTEHSCYAGHAAGVAYLAKAASVIVDPPSESISCACVDLRVNALHLTDALCLQNAWPAVMLVARATTGFLALFVLTDVAAQWTVRLIPARRTKP
jgi:hypothetical protein